MKKTLVLYICLLSFTAANASVKIDSDKVNGAKQYCLSHDYDTLYCLFVDFSVHCGKPRMYLYSFSADKVLAKSLCSHGVNKDSLNIYKPIFSNVRGSNLSCLGKFKVTGYVPMSKFPNKGFHLDGLEKTNSNTSSRGILIHKGNFGTSVYPLPCVPSQGCFCVDDEMMKNIEDIINRIKKPILLWAYK